MEAKTKKITSRYKPSRIVPFDLYNISPFIVGDHPELHPQTTTYEKYWLEQTEYCIEGKWGYDYDEEKGKGGWRWMPPELYFYINMLEIEDTDIYGNTDYRPPQLRDIEWLVFYGLTACDGFSGFYDDDEYTCFRGVDKLNKGKSLTPAERVRLDKLGHLFKKPNGEWKEYKEARKYLYETRGKKLGKPHYLNDKKHFLLLSTRGGGKSYMMAALITHQFTFNNARTLKGFLTDSSKSTVSVGAYDSTFSKELLEKVEYMYKNSLKLRNGAWNPLSENGEHGWFYHPTDPVTMSLGKSGSKVANHYKSKSGDSFIGVGSTISHVSFYNNAQAAVGKRTTRIIVEEAGLLKNFEDVHRENKGTLNRDFGVGFCCYIGTGGNMKKIEGIKSAYLNPDSYDILAYEDVFSGTLDPIGLFIPAYYRKNIHKDSQGNTLLEQAFQSELEEREAVKQAENDSSRGAKSYSGHIISYPIIPAEMFMEAGDNVFDTERAQKRLLELEEGLWNKKAVVGKMIYTNYNNTKVKFEPDLKGEMKPIIHWGDENKGSNKTGATIIYEHPVDNLPKPSFNNPLYLVLYDPVKNAEGTSLASVLVFKAWYGTMSSRESLQFTIVAEWIGRYEGDHADENHDMALKLAQYYNAKILPETNHDEFVRYVNRKKKFHMLQPTPGLSQKEMMSRTKFKSVGYYLAPSKKTEVELYAKYLTEKVIDKRVSLKGSEVKSEELNFLDSLYSIRLLEEVINYRSGGNYDHMSSLFLLAVYLTSTDIKPRNVESEEKESARSHDHLKELVTDRNMFM